MVEKIDGGGRDEWHWIRDENHLRRRALQYKQTALQTAKLQFISEIAQYVKNVVKQHIYSFKTQGRTTSWPKNALKEFCLSISVSLCLDDDDDIGDDDDDDDDDGDDDDDEGVGDDDDDDD